jgi:hypothetical protein
MRKHTRRPIRFTVCLSPDESRMLGEIATADGDDQADVLRRHIRRTHADRFGESRSRAEVTAP